MLATYKAKKAGSSKVRTKSETLRKADIKKKQHYLYASNLVGDVKANPRDFYRYINSQKKKDRQGIPSLKKGRGNGVAESDSERAEELIAQFNAFNKTEYKEVPFIGRSGL